MKPGAETASGTAGGQQTADGNAAEDGEITQVAEFGPGEETYRLDIASIDEIVDAGELTAISNAPRLGIHLRGVFGSPYQAAFSRSSAYVIAIVGSLSTPGSESVLIAPS